MSREEDAGLALMCLGSENIFAKQGPTVLEPALDSWIAPADWLVRGYITGQDALFRKLGPLALGDMRVFYGFVLEAAHEPGKFVALIRGTGDLIEWLIDGEFLPRTPHPLAGEVESGFWGLAQTLRCRRPGGLDQPLVAGIRELVGKGSVTVVGHSLGAALATYVALDLAQSSIPVRARIFASPRPGDGAFALCFAHAVSDFVGYADPLDIVTHVPPGLGYTTLPGTIEVSPFGLIRIKLNPDCLHHAMSYATKIFPGSVDLSNLSAQDQVYAACICEQLPAAS